MSIKTQYILFLAFIAVVIIFWDCCLIFKPFKREQTEEAQIQTNNEVICFQPLSDLQEQYPNEVVMCIGYDFGYVCRVVTAEAGVDDELCMGVAQCIFNGCKKERWKYSPEKILEIYKYTDPADWVSDEAYQACKQIFIDGATYYPVQDSVYFYAPKYCTSSWHESKDFVIDIHGVMFFEERGE